MNSSPVKTRTLAAMAGVFLLAFTARFVPNLSKVPATVTAFSEPVGIALSLVRNGTYADAYGVGVGPTAHSMPLHPLILAGVLSLFGTGRAGALMMSAVACAAAAMACAMLLALTWLCGFSRWVGWIAATLAALGVMNFWAQTSGSFDAPFTMLALVALCSVGVGCWTRAAFTPKEGVLLGVVAGLAGLLNVVILAVLALWLGFGFFGLKARRREFLGFSAVAACAVAILFTPWVIRNYLAFGRFIPVRSNFGLELEVSNNDFATFDLEKNVRSEQFIHPFAKPAEREKVKQIGEPAYQDDKKHQAYEWIWSHKRMFARLTGQRIFYFWFPSMNRSWQTLSEAGLTLLGLGGLALLWRRSRRLFSLFACALAGYWFIYCFIQVSPRYRCPIEPLLFLLGVYGLQAALTASTLRRENHRALPYN